MYILLTDEKIVKEIIPTFHPALPGVPIEKRYPADLVASFLWVDDSADVSAGRLYDEETGSFVEPPVTEVDAEENTDATPAEQREQAYNSERIIEWDGDMITVTEASQKWQYYAAEGSDKANELTMLIAQAKQSIREKYPDTEVPADGN